MNKWIFAAFLVVASIFCIGWYDQPSHYNRETVYYVVTSRDTIWDICSDYINKQNRYKTLDEFTWYVRKDNNLLGAKFIHVGDIITIHLYNKKGVLECLMN